MGKYTVIMASKFKIQKFRTNDLSNDSGKQFELGKSWCEDFFEIPSSENEFIIDLVFKPLIESHFPYQDKVIELKLSAPTARADRKAYANGEYGQSQIKEFFINKLNLQSSNLQDCFAIYKATNDQYYLYVVPHLLYDNFIRLFTDANLSIFNEKKNQHNEFNNVLQQIYYGAPGTGKSHEINRLTKGKEVVRTTFHPDSDYSTFVGAYKPTSIEIPVRDVTGKVIVEGDKQVTENRIVYEFVEQAFLQAYIKAWNAYIDASEEEKPKDIYLVIEEINRGNCAQIFGDLFQLLDRNGAGFSDYPIQADKDMKKQLTKAFSGKNIADAERINNIYEKDIVAQVLKGEILLLPDNLYIWATMNTSDQSLFPIDSAFKRRWDWQYTPICEGKSNDGQPLGWKIKANGNEYDWWTFIQKINAEVEEMTKSEDKKLGYFFCKPINGIISAETFVGKVIFYLWNDVFKDQDLGNIFNDNEDKELTFNSFYGVDNYGKAVVKEEVVEMFLNNLDLKPHVEIVSDETN